MLLSAQFKCVDFSEGEKSQISEQGASLKTAIVTVLLEVSKDKFSIHISPSMGKHKFYMLFILLR